MRAHDVHHIHKRKRLKQYPHPNPWVSFLDKLLIVVAVLAPFTTIPQIFKIYWQHNAAGVSGVTWVLYTILAIPWIVYGIVHKEKPIIIGFSLWFIVDLLVVYGAFMYG